MAGGSGSTIDVELGTGVTAPVGTQSLSSLWQEPERCGANDDVEVRAQ